MRNWIIAFVVPLASACVLPRSIMLGQTAAPVGNGATEVGVFGGILYLNQTNPPFFTTDDVGEPVSNQPQGRVFGAPSAEANIQHGFSDRFALNVHLSPAGIQPGVKWNINDSKIAHLALLPAFALGYASYGGTTFSAGADGIQSQVDPNAVTAFSFLVGLKLLFSHQNGFFAGLGYDFSLNRSLKTGVIGTGNVKDPTETLAVYYGHQVAASIGLDVKLGMVHIRPEVAFAFLPGLVVQETRRVAPAEMTQSNGGGYGFAVFGGFSVAVQSPARESAPEDETSETQDPRSIDDDSNGGEEDEPPPLRSRGSDDGTEDFELPRKKRKRHQSDDQWKED
jgi:hypothetical protein